MSRRSTSEKKLNRLRKALRTELPCHLDLVQWLKDHRYADTTRQAHKLILAGRVRSESHPLGIKQVPVMTAEGVQHIDVVDRYVPASVRSSLCVVSE
jgi:hypothetical protein